MTIILVGLVPFVFLLWVWGAGLRNPGFVRFPWGADTGLLVHKGDELRLLKLNAPFGLPTRAYGLFSSTGTYYHLFVWPDVAVKKDIAVPQWALVAAYVAIFMTVYVRMGVKRNRGRAEVLEIDRSGRTLVFRSRFSRAAGSLDCVQPAAEHGGWSLHPGHPGP